MLFKTVFTALLIGVAMANPVITQDSPVATGVVAKAQQQAPPAAPPAPQATDDQFWLDFTKTFDPMAAPPTPAPATSIQDWQYRQTTYYTCVTYSMGGEHCGWHIPILEVSAAPGPGSGLDKTVAIASLIVAVVALILA